MFGSAACASDISTTACPRSACAKCLLEAATGQEVFVEKHEEGSWLGPLSDAKELAKI